MFIKRKDTKSIDCEQVFCLTFHILINILIAYCISYQCVSGKKDKNEKEFALKTQHNKRIGGIDLIVGIIITLMVFSSALYADKNKDLVLVLDTSLSMAGYGGKNILPRVKESLPRFIDQLEEDDSITFITFDTDVKVYPRIVIEDESNREVIKKYISMVEARGKWTYTMRMMRTVFATAQELEDEYPDRERVIVVLTDALDDPPPWHAGAHFNIKSIAEEYSGKEWFIHFVSLGNLKQNKKIS